MFDDAGTSEADQRARFCHDDIADKGERGGNAAHRRVGEDGEEGQTAFRKTGERRRGFCHLHQGKQAFLHPRPAGSGDADEGHIFFQRRLDAAHETLAQHGTHRAAHEAEFKTGGDHWQGLDSALDDHEGIRFARAFGGVFQPRRVGFAVFEFETIDGQHFATDFLPPFGVQQEVKPLPRFQAMVIAALGADLKIRFQIGRVQHRLARRALAPQAFRQGVTTRRGVVAVDFGG